ncbi:MAG: hypothetical protein JWQ28_1420 [Pedobacter sp.]|jgi:hypothetical protein|nr:hypothetical protein [Pedobacter sp.]
MTPEMAMRTINLEKVLSDLMAMRWAIKYSVFKFFLDKIAGKLLTVLKRTADFRRRKNAIIIPITDPIHSYDKTCE